MPQPPQPLPPQPRQPLPPQPRQPPQPRRRRNLARRRNRAAAATSGMPFALFAGSGAFPVKDIERRQADVGDFLLGERDRGTRYGGPKRYIRGQANGSCGGCAARQRSKTRRQLRRPVRFPSDASASKPCLGIDLLCPAAVNVLQPGFRQPKTISSASVPCKARSDADWASLQARRHRVPRLHNHRRRQCRRELTSSSITSTPSQIEGRQRRKRRHRSAMAFLCFPSPAVNAGQRALAFQSCAAE